MVEEKKKFIRSLYIPIGFILILWILIISETLFSLSFVKYGNRPGEISGLIGVLTSPLIHGSFGHLFSNTIPLLVLGISILYFYPESSVKVIALVYILPGILVWIFGRESYHIGASGIVYGLVAFLFFSGVIRKDKRAIALALLVTFIYGGLIWGVFPGEKGISWESHLFGGMTGIFAAIIFRKEDPYKKYDWENEEDDVDPRTLEISHKKGYPLDEDWN